MKEIKAYIRPHMLDSVLRALHEHPDFPGVTVSSVQGFGKAVGRNHGSETGFGTVKMSKLECIVEDSMADDVVGVIREHASTDRPGDGKIIVTALGSVIRIRTGESGGAALE